MGGEGGGEKRNRENERARVRDKAARLSPVCVPRIRVPRPWNTFTGFTANRHVYTMLIIGAAVGIRSLTPDSLFSPITILCS